MKTTVKRVFLFDKIAYSGDRRINLTEVTLEFVLSKTFVDGKQIGSNYYLSIYGGIWNSSRTEHVCVGQNLDMLQVYFKHNVLFNLLYRLWSLYHLKYIKDIPKEDVHLIKLLLGKESLLLPQEGE